MSFQVSPGINISEIDLTSIIPAVSSTQGAIAGVFKWGPTDLPVLVSSEIELANRFGKPATGFNIETFFTAADFLSYGNALYVQRVSDGDNASSTIVAATLDVVDIDAKYVGTYGNAIKVIFTGQTAYGSATSGIKAITGRAPSSIDKIHIAVIDNTGVFSGAAGTVLEVYENLSTVAGAKTEDGSNNYFVDAVNNRSNFIKLLNPVQANFSLLDDADAVVVLAGGTDGSSESAISAGVIIGGYDKFVSAAEIDISLIMQGKALGTNNVQIANHIIDNICEVRKDCVAFISPPASAVVNVPGNELANILTFSGNVSNSSYAVVDSGYKYRYDKYNDSYVYTPLNGDIAGLCARTDETRDPWFSPAGYNRGMIKNCLKLAYNPSSQAARDALYKADVNPVITQTGQGTLLYGDKTHLGRASAFDRINVRRLFIILEKSISRAAKTMLFEFNDEFTRAQFRNMVEPFLRDVQGRRGIYDFRVVCDETNNTAQVIDSNRFIGDIYVKPARSINFIQLNFIAVRSGVEFEEIVGKPF